MTVYKEKMDRMEKFFKTIAPAIESLYSHEKEYVHYLTFSLLYDYLEIAERRPDFITDHMVSFFPIWIDCKMDGRSKLWSS